MKKTVRNYMVRLVILFGGLVTAHLGVTLFLLSDLGADPFNVLIQGLHRTAGAAGFRQVTHGMVHMAVCFLIIVILLAADRSYIRPGTIVCMFFGGPIIDFFSSLLEGLHIPQAPIPIKILILIIGCLILAFGMTIVIRSEAGTGPNDLVAVVISEKTGKRFGPVRISVDFCFVAAGALLGGRFGPGTLICAFLVGPAADLAMPYSEKLVRFFLAKAGIPES